MVKRQTPGPEVYGLETYLRCVKSFSNQFTPESTGYTQEALGWHLPDMTEKLFTRTLNLHTPNMI